MPLNLLTLPAAEAERIAYAEGFTMTAELLAQIADLEAERDQLAQELEATKAAADDDSLKHWEKENGDPEQYKDFFFDCFARLTVHHFAPDISSDYDKSVIFAAIERGEEAEANGGEA